ncbi:MAG: RlmE family RNA methyltransferase [Desulfobacteraceae bacterium]|jgi:23S rRNA (uridine2552-2'-O)-methyltransferase
MDKMGGRNRWEDHYTRRARDEKWVARSVYKLQEIDRRCKLMARDHRLLDLGCYPGSWSQYALEKVGPGGEVVGMDLKAPERLSAPNFRFIKADVMTLDLQWLVQEIGLRDTVISDLAPQTTGIKVADTSRSMELAEKAFDISLTLLKKGGHFLTKVFEGEDLKALRNEVQERFDQMRLIRPSAVRKGSKEIYLLGLHLAK